MTNQRREADQLAERLDALLSTDKQPAGVNVPPDNAVDPAVAAALRLAQADHPAMSPEFQRVLAVQVRAAAARQTAGRARWYRQPAWMMTAVVMLAAVGLLAALALQSEVGPMLSANTMTPTVTPTVEQSVTPSLTLTLTASPSVTPTPTLTITPLAADGEAQPSTTELPTELPGETVYDCSNQPADNAQALGWRQHCEGGLPPNELAPGQTGSVGNSEQTHNRQGSSGQGNNGQSPGQSGQ